MRARLWFTVACSSTTPLQQLTAFQKTITTLTVGTTTTTHSTSGIHNTQTALYVVDSKFCMYVCTYSVCMNHCYAVTILFQSCSHTWQKVDYLVAFSEWLYTHQCPVQDALSHLQWALTLLLQQEEGEGEEGEGAKEGEEEREEGEVARPVCVLEKAVCVHVMMAQLQGRGSQGHRESCLAAVAYCYLIWKVGCVLYIATHCYVYTVMSIHSQKILTYLCWHRLPWSHMPHHCLSSVMCNYPLPSSSGLTSHLLMRYMYMHSESTCICMASVCA